MLPGSLRAFHRFLRNEDGPTTVEYAVLLSLIVIVCIGAINALGVNASSTFGSLSGSFGGSNEASSGNLSGSSWVMGNGFSLSLNPDGTVSIGTGSDSRNLGTWTQDGSQATVQFAPDNAYNISVTGNTATLTATSSSFNAGETFSFSKSS